MKKNIIFDFGGVVFRLVYLNVKEVMQISDDEAEFLKREIIESSEWLALDEGTMQTDEVLKKWLDRTPAKFLDIARNFLQNYAYILPAFPQTINLINNLKKQNYKVFYLSNCSESFFENEKNKNTIEIFDGGVVSYKEKLMKPQREIYEVLLKRYNLIASECVFLDDREENIIGAENCGINGILFDNKNIEKAKDELKKLGVKCD